MAAMDTQPQTPSAVDTLDPDRFREILRQWAATVGVVAVRDDDRVYGTTITSFTPVNADPPLVLISLGANAQALPFLHEGTAFVVNFLAEDQERIAAVYADSFPVGPSPFPDEGPPVIDGALAALHCRVNKLVAVEGANRLVLAWVEEGRVDAARRPLLWHRRGTARLADDG